MSDREKDIEILAPRHQLLVLQRQVGKLASNDTDASSSGRLHRLPGGRCELRGRPVSRRS
ncbi:hypothetical protein ACFVY1_36310 [Streptomyces sp. NPDC058293]|uniref:hypothetical protein n=1 Tax=Streptomyces sp. NPDC058293 TaxID=3346429 RepID=UPI0036DFEF28